METFIEFDEIDEKGPMQLRQSVDIAAAELDREEVDRVGDVMVELEARPGSVEGEYELEGKVDFQADLVCARCLEPYPFVQTAEFALRYRPLSDRPEPVEEEEVEIGSEDLDIEYVPDRRVPLRQIAVEQIQLSIPMKPLCEERCLGLCVQCGGNKNRSECSCQENLVDERWDALKGLRDQLSKKKEI
jgi:uncharacterized protein